MSMLRRSLARCFVIACSLLVVGCTAEAPPRAVHVLTIDGEINPVVSRYLARGIELAESEQAAAVVIRVGTPGGSIDSMREAVGEIDQARVPVITWVGPAGAQAASAGTWILPRTLPLTCTGISSTSALRYAGSATGQA